MIDRENGQSPDDTWVEPAVPHQAYNEDPSPDSRLHL
jgi:hypothetical protein